jgi:branched-chain amino acid transport system ATP-binding protein
MSLLQVEQVNAFYGDFQALFGVSIEVAESETVAIIGSNGAGKSTLLKAIAGLRPVHDGRVLFEGRDIARLRADERVRLGISLVPEGRRVFPSLTVLENLLVGGYAKRPGIWNAEAVLDLFPVLRDRQERSGAVLSGGEQQALAIGRALMANPRLLLLDEVSLGLAPIIVSQLYRALPKIAAAGTTILVVEQNTEQAMAASARLYCLLEGRISLAGDPKALTHQQVTAAYFGV